MIDKFKELASKEMTTIICNEYENEWVFWKQQLDKVKSQIHRLNY